LLNFSEPSGNLVQHTDLNELVESTLPLLKTALRNLNLHLLLSKEPVPVFVQHSQLQQVIFNLINNACQAMSTSGTLILKTWREGTHSLLSVTDDGPGISEELQKHIFEPFFTTKEVGSGTGLGLSVSRNIVEKSGGDLSLTSRVGEGTTFTIKLPSAQVSPNTVTTLQ
jgi:two-component system NtrC family sensor kinase